MLKEEFIILKTSVWPLWFVFPWVDVVKRYCFYLTIAVIFLCVNIPCIVFFPHFTSLTSAASESQLLTENPWKSLVRISFVFVQQYTRYRRPLPQPVLYKHYGKNSPFLYTSLVVFQQYFFCPRGYFLPSWGRVAVMLGYSRPPTSRKHRVIILMKIIMTYCYMQKYPHRSFLPFLWWII